MQAHMPDGQCVRCHRTFKRFPSWAEKRICRWCRVDLIDCHKAIMKWLRRNLKKEGRNNG